jgi:hypothetical protein
LTGLAADFSAGAAVLSAGFAGTPLERKSDLAVVGCPNARRLRM